MNAQRSYTLIGAASAVAFGAALLVGGAFGLLQDGRLPALDLDPVPHIIALLTEGREDEAFRELQTVALLELNNPRGLDLMAQVAAARGDQEARLRALRLMLHHRPEDPAIRLRLARALLEEAHAARPGAAARKAERAVANAEEAQRLAPESAEVQVTLGDARLLLGDRQAARRHWQEALRLDPSLDSARRRLENDGEPRS